MLLAKIEALEHTAAAQQKQIDTLTGQIDNAYAKVQDIAVKAVSKERSPAVYPSARESRESGD